MQFCENTIQNHVLETKKLLKQIYVLNNCIIICQKKKNVNYAVAKDNSKKYWGFIFMVNN